MVISVNCKRHQIFRLSEDTMILLLGGTNVVIRKLEISRLHGIYNYSVAFNSDITFIYGENGCGKTTILDIVSSIVTGKLYNLFAYKFDTITLSYNMAKRCPLNKVIITRPSERPYTLSIEGFGESEIIEDPRKMNGFLSREEGDYTVEHRFMEMYQFPHLLRREFNYIYLPLSRNSQDGFDFFDSTPYRRRRVLYSEQDIINKNYLNDSLRYVEEVVRTSCMRISSLENAVNSRFRSSIFTSSLKINSEYNFAKLLRSVKISSTTSTSIEKSKEEYIKTLQVIDEWNEDISKRIESFFEKYRSTLEAAQRDAEIGHSGVTLDFLLMHMEFNRIKEIAAQAQEMEEEKRRIRTPITAFLAIVNKFFGLGEDKKIVSIDDEGRIAVFAENPRRKMSLYNLSSGEKQIIIIFACLIFGLQSKENGIYIIDEPEASLHLAWQKMFVESIREINKSIQLIFATHAPEIIGKYVDKTVKLKKR